MRADNPHGPRTEEEQAAYVEWQQAVADGSTVLGFRSYFNDRAREGAIRRRVVDLADRMVATLADPTQAWDIAVADFNYEIGLIVPKAAP